METTRERASRPGFTLPRERVFWAVALGHLANDIFTGIGPVLLTYLSVTVMPIHVAQIALAVSLKEIVGAVTQPLFGWVTDRVGGRWLGVGGVTFHAVVLMLALSVAKTGQFWLMLLPFALSALGSGAFHPVGAKYAAESELSREASNTAYFFLLGQIGLAVGPALAGFLLESANKGNAGPLAPLYLVFAIGLPGVVLMATSLPDMNSHSASVSRIETHDTSSSTRHVSQLAPGTMAVLALFGIAMSLRSIVNSSAVSFAPVLFQQKGWSPSQYGVITGAFWLASGVTTVLWGELADRFDPRHVMTTALFATVPPLALLPYFDGPIAFLPAIAAGGTVGGTMSLFVVMVQRLLPERRAFASGLSLGFSFVTGAVGSTLLGVLADGPASLIGFSVQTAQSGLGLEAVYIVLAGMALLAALLNMTLPAWISRSTLASRRVSLAGET